MDVALGVAHGLGLTALELGDLASRLEAAAGRRVDLILMEEAQPGMAYRIFPDGRIIVERDRPALVARRARAIIGYRDFQRIEELCTRGVPAAAAHGR